MRSSEVRSLSLSVEVSDATVTSLDRRIAMQRRRNERQEAQRQVAPAVSRPMGTAGINNVNVFALTPPPLETRIEATFENLIKIGVARPLAEGEAWQELGSCKELEPQEFDELFFPERAKGSSKLQKKICGACAVRDKCLEQALADDEIHGIWGGMTEKDRRRLKRGIL